MSQNEQNGAIFDNLDLFSKGDHMSPCNNKLIFLYSLRRGGQIHTFPYIDYEKGLNDKQPTRILVKEINANLYGNNKYHGLLNENAPLV